MLPLPPFQRLKFLLPYKIVLAADVAIHVLWKFTGKLLFELCIPPRSHRVGAQKITESDMTEDVRVIMCVNMQMVRADITAPFKKEAPPGDAVFPHRYVS
jgi:hypothetical protein